MSLFVGIAAGTNVSYQNELVQLNEKVPELVRFDSLVTCQELVQSMLDDYVLLIVAEDQIEEISKLKILELRHVQSILLFDPVLSIPPEQVLQLQQMSYKIHEPFSSLELLCKFLGQWIEDFSEKSNILFSTLANPSSTAMTTNVVNNVADFAELWYPLYLAFVLDLSLDDRRVEQRRFVEECRRHFSRKLGVLRLIDEFERNYTPEKALFYYSRDGFIYRLINRALRGQSIEVILTFRFLLRDIREQLRIEYRHFSTLIIGSLGTFYRGQQMFCEELNELRKKHRTGTLITTNSYFSTSRNRQIALLFAGRATEGMVSVLFVITAAIQADERTPFAYIGYQSAFGHGEEEVLFSIGSFFQIKDISFDSIQSLWIVEMIFVDEDLQKQLEITRDFRPLQTSSLELMLVKIGNLLANRPGQGRSTALTFYKLIIDQQFSEVLTAACHVGLGWLSLKHKDLPLAIEQQEKALQLCENLPGECTALRAMCYNCLGHASRQQKEYQQALNYFFQASRNTPIDKYAAYDGYRNVLSMNIAVTYQLMHQESKAWDVYKTMLAREMNSSVRFHGHTYLTIAQAGESFVSRIAFLDVSLSSMSSNYRRSIISGVLLLGFEYANNAETRTMVIDYLKKVINHSQRYIEVNRDDRLIVQQCHNQISSLCIKERIYPEAMDHAYKAMKTCHVDDLGDIIQSYQNLVQAFEQQLIQSENDFTSEEIDRILLCNESEEPTKIVFKRDEFAFGQFTSHRIDPGILRHFDRRRSLVVCLLKLAALMQKSIDHGHLEEISRLLNRARVLLNDEEVQKICTNNFAYLQGDFEAIIQRYTEDLRSAEQRHPGQCIAEDAFGYIAHLYERKSEFDQERDWYEAAVRYFQSHEHLCEHTVKCFRHLADYHQRHDDLVGAVQVSRHLVQHLLIHRADCFLRVSIDSIVMKLIEHFENERVSRILQHFVELLLVEPADDHCALHHHFRQIMVECSSKPLVILDAYSSYLQVLLELKSSKSLFLEAQPAFELVISTYHGQKLIEAYEHWIELLVHRKVDRWMVEVVLKRWTLEMEVISTPTRVLAIYNFWARWILPYLNDVGYLLSAAFILTRCQFIQLKGGASVGEEMKSVLRVLLQFYHDIADPHFVLAQYLETGRRKDARESVTGVYLKLLEFCFKCRSSKYLNYMKTKSDALSDQPKALLKLITDNRVDYRALIFTVSESCVDPTISSFVPSTFESSADEWMKPEQQNTDWSELCFYLLEWQSIDDERLASCHLKLNDLQAAKAVFDPTLYGDLARRLNANAHRRSLDIFL